MRLTAVAALAMFPVAAQAQWRVTVQNPAVDSLLRVGQDTASTERAFCLEAVPNRVTRELEVFSALPATSQRGFGDSTSFECPGGAVPLHEHYLVRDHVQGPSSWDKAVARRLQTPAVVAVVSFDRRSVQYVVYGSLPR